MGVFVRGSKLWIRFRDAAGKWRNITTGLAVGNEQIAAEVFTALVADPPSASMPMAKPAKPEPEWLVRERERKQRRREYDASPERRAKRRAYRQRPDVRARRAELQRERARRPDQRRRRALYDRVRDRNPERLAKKRKYFARPEVREGKRALDRAYHQRSEVKARQRANKISLRHRLSAEQWNAIEKEVKRRRRKS